MLQRNLGRQGQRKGEAGTGVAPACHPDPAAETFDDAFADMQSQAESLGFSHQGIAGLAEFVEDRPLIGAGFPELVIILDNG